MKRSDVYIIYHDVSGEKAVKVKGYMFEKKRHWFTVRHRDPNILHDSTRYKKWIVSDFVTGIIMTNTDNNLADVPNALPESMIDKLIELYSDNSTSMYRRESAREGFQKYAQMINDAMYKDGQDKLIDLLQDSGTSLIS